MKNLEELIESVIMHDVESNTLFTHNEIVYEFIHSKFLELCMEYGEYNTFDRMDEIDVNVSCGLFNKKQKYEI